MVEITKKYFYHLRKKAGVCVECGQEDAFTIIGKTYCAECAEKRNNRKRKYLSKNEHYAKWESEYKKKQYYDRKESGICVRCGKRKTNGHVQCDICRASQRRMWDRKYKKPRGGDGVCYSCNKEKPIEGKKLCEHCYGERLKALEKARKVRWENFYKQKAERWVDELD